jgi:integrase/recombinase XerD
MADELVPLTASGQLSTGGNPVPVLITLAGQNAQFAYDEFFYGTISNEHTRRAYRYAVNRFLNWVDDLGVELRGITPKMVRSYLDKMPGEVATQKLHLAALRNFFDVAVTRHAIFLNPAASVRGRRYRVVEGKTPEITVQQARRLLASIDAKSLIGLRDRVVIATLIYTAARIGAVMHLKRGDFADNGGQHVLRFSEKGGKSREIPVRHDLAALLFEYLDAAQLRDAGGHTPLFLAAYRRTGRFTAVPLTADDARRMIKRRMKGAGLSSRLSPHSFRVCTITDLLGQGTPLEDVQYLAGHCDPRTTRLYDRRQKKVTRSIVERISV